jgi:hypothetical protein
MQHKSYKSIKIVGNAHSQNNDGDLWFMMFNATFNNNLEKTIDLSQVTGKLYHIMLYTSLWLRFQLTTSVMIDTDCIGSCKSNYHTNTATTAPDNGWR